MDSVNLMKQSYKVHRKNSREIYKGFGFEHLSDGTPYYVHPDNQSFNQTTTLSQPIGEALVLFTELMQHLMQGRLDIQGDILHTENETFLELIVPSDWEVSGVIVGVQSFIAKKNKNQISYSLYDAKKQLLPAPEEYNDPANPLLSCFMVLFAEEYLKNKNWAEIFDQYLELPNVELFVNLHEDFYQNHKFEEYHLDYTSFSIESTKMTKFSEMYQTIIENKQSLKQVKQIVSKQFSRELFSEENLMLIPQLSKEFQLDPKLNGVVNAVVEGDALAVLLHGPAGTGKTSACKLICQEAQLPLLETINATENLDEFILGKYLPKDNRIVFQESYVTKAIREGGAVIFEEINFAKPQYLAFLNSLLDDNGFVRLDSGEVVKRHPDFRFFATMNLGYFGTKELNQALFNRFNIVIELDELSDTSIERMLMARVPEVKDHLDKIFGIYHKIKTKIATDELDVVLSPRNLENWARLAKHEGYLSAAEKTLIPIARNDRYFEQTIRDILMLYKWE